jgi:FKBP-type peptidyl-prolyl cis-trans isomerase
MRVGGQRVLYIPGELGYGPAGNAKAGIEPNEPLIFEVELIATQ